MTAIVAICFGQEDKVPLSGGVMTGTLTLAGAIPLNVPAATAGQVLVSDAAGNLTPQNPVSTSSLLTDSAGGLWLVSVSTSGVLSALPILQDQALAEITDEAGVLLI